ncbi:MAG: alkaline phosphatase family protein, partial [Planctomycetota bacterium]
MRLLVLVVAVGLAVFAGVRLLARADRAAAPPRGLLIVTIDTLRADAAGRGKGTPAIEKFLSEATLYARARTPAPLTLPAHVSLFSGLRPARHGVHDNASAALPADRGFPLLAEELRDAGFLTAAFVSCAVVSARTGIAAGFEQFDCPEFGPQGSGEHGDPLADGRVTAPLEWLGALAPGQRFFLWVHFFDPHDPY